MYRGNHEDDAGSTTTYGGEKGNAYLQWEITHHKVRQMLDRAAELLKSCDSIPGPKLVEVVLPPPRKAVVFNAFEPAEIPAKKAA
jgi:hypothetical protein